MIALVTGQPGSGKSFYCMRELVQAFHARKFVATNVEVDPRFNWVVANDNALRWAIPGRRAKVAGQLADRLYVSDNLSDLMRLRMPGRGEGRGLMILDEAHMWLNSRMWQADDRTEIVRFFTQHRKLGWDILLVSQFIDAIDKQVKALAEYHIQLRNLKRAKVWGIPVMPINMFLAVWTWNGIMSKNIAKRQAYPLKKKYARLYDTMALSHGLDEDGGDGRPPLWFPGHGPDGRRTDAHGNAGAPDKGTRGAGRDRHSPAGPALDPPGGWDAVCLDPVTGQLVPFRNGRDGNAATVGRPYS